MATKNIIQSSIVLLLFSPYTSFAQKNKMELDLIAIKSMEGCYNVEFKYTETFAPEVDYEKAYDYTSAGFEWAKIIEQTDEKVVIQHLLIINDSTIIKHWRQDWTYEKTNSYRFVKDNKWVYEKLNKKDIVGKWTQEVFQVDDSPRYAGTATWTHVDGVSTWFNKADSPLPRREYSKRNDYNVLKRGNRIQILQSGWIHEQDNDKIIRKNSEKDVLLVQEKGYNTYDKRSDSDCESAKNWWVANKDKWSNVRNVWSEIYGTEKDLELKADVEGKMIFEYLFMEKRFTEKEEIKTLLDKYVVN